jgi:trehalose/maltose hydrolase-like predicted phosphorylase
LLGCSKGSDPPKAATVAEKYPWDGASWATDIVIDGPVEDQQAVRSFIHYLKQNVGEGRLGPFGNTNERYKGRVFWDADVWVFPALALIDPELARAIPEFRIASSSYSQIVTCRELGGTFTKEADRISAMGANFVHASLPLKFSWEVDSTGSDKINAPTGKQEHVSGGVVWGLRLADDLGLAEPQRAKDIGEAVARYYLARSSVYVRDARQIKDVVSVDEWHEGDNCLYTNVVADWTIKHFLGWDLKFKFPRNAKGELVAYDGDTERAYQQAAAPLILWPLEREDLVEDPIAFLDRFEGKEGPDGPAMSLSVYALIRARYGDVDHAHKTWRTSWKKYTDGNPQLLFSERPGRKDLTYFNTGAAGCLNAVIYGFIGARIVDDATADRAKIPLNNDRWLVFRPNLPKAWKTVTFKGMRVMGESYDVVCEGRTATVTKKLAAGQ